MRVGYCPAGQDAPRLKWIGASYQSHHPDVEFILHPALNPNSNFQEVFGIRVRAYSVT